MTRPLDPTPSLSLKTQLKSLLEHRDLSAAELSRKSGVSKQLISLWLAGGRPTKLEKLKAVAGALGVTVDHLCFGDSSQLHTRRDLELEALLSEQWVSGVFEVRLRRLRPQSPNANRE
jgi:transcriptional regulator with XRE-family HTH domain